MDGYSNSTTHIRPIVIIVASGWILSRTIVTDLVENLKKYSNKAEQCHIKIIDIDEYDFKQPYLSQPIGIELPRFYTIFSSEINSEINLIEEFHLGKIGSTHLIPRKLKVLPEKIFEIDCSSYSHLNPCYILVSDLETICEKYDPVIREYFEKYGGFENLLAKIPRPARLYALGKGGRRDKSLLDFVEGNSLNVYDERNIPELAKAVLQYREPVRPPKPKTVMAEVPVFTVELPLLAGAVYDND